MPGSSSTKLLSCAGDGQIRLTDVEKDACVRKFALFCPVFVFACLCMHICVVICHMCIVMS